MTDILDRNFRVTGDTHAQRVADETVLLHLGNAAYYGMNPVGTAIWRGIEDGRTVRETCAAIAAEHDADPQEVERDARLFVQDLIDNRIIDSE